MEQSTDSKITLPYDARKSGLLAPRIVEKPWGREEWIVHNDSYVMKLLFVNAGECLSKQYHEEKMETLKLVQGKVVVHFGAEGDTENEPETFVLHSDENVALHVNPKTIHRFEAIEDAVFVEVSTPQLMDVVRLEDRYNRPQTYVLEQQLEQQLNQ
jgi:mannose-6-phosphate isomerase